MERLKDNNKLRFCKCLNGNFFEKNEEVFGGESGRENV